MTQIDQRWLDERMYSEPADLEPELNRLVDDAGHLADAEHQLIEAIKEKKARLEQLPDIIRRLEHQLSGVSYNLAETLEYHDKLAAAHKLLTAKQQPAEAGNNPLTKNVASCPGCDNMNCASVSKPDGDGICEYHCLNCGHYFFDDAPGDGEVEA